MAPMAIESGHQSFVPIPIKGGWGVYVGFLFFIALGVVVPAIAFLYLGYAASWSITKDNQIQIANIMVGFLTVDGLLLGFKTRLRETLGTTEKELKLAGAFEAFQMSMLTLSLFWSLITMFFASFSTDLSLVTEWFRNSIVIFYFAVALYSAPAILVRMYTKPYQS